jgi:cell pole-organizing protein PopZ
MANENPPPGSGTGPNASGADPSMEDILASIRRILNEEDTKPADAPAHGPADDVLDLDEGMMVAAPDANPAPAPTPPPPPAPPPPAPPPPAPPPPSPLPVAVAEQPLRNEPPASSNEPLPARDMAADLIAPEAAAAAATSVGQLLRTLASERSTQVHRGGPTIEDLVREEIRPLLKLWLDSHLAPLVERLVRAEIERVVSRMT